MSEGPQTTPPDAALKARRLDHAFLAVFGPLDPKPNDLSEDQQLVRAALREICYVEQPIFRSDSDAIGAAYRDGARSIFLVIQNRLQRAVAEPKQKPKKTRR